MSYSEEEAFQDFDNWYQQCLENGIEPESIVKRMGEMILITTETTEVEEFKIKEDEKIIQITNESASKHTPGGIGILTNHGRIGWRSDMKHSYWIEIELPERE